MNNHVKLLGNELFLFDLKLWTAYNVPLYNQIIDYNVKKY